MPLPPLSPFEVGDVICFPKEHTDMRNTYSIEYENYYGFKIESIFYQGIMLQYYDSKSFFMEGEPMILNFTDHLSGYYIVIRSKNEIDHTKVFPKLGKKIEPINQVPGQNAGKSRNKKSYKRSRTYKR